MRYYGTVQISRLVGKVWTSRGRISQFTGFIAFHFFLITSRSGFRAPSLPLRVYMQCERDAAIGTDAGGCKAGLAALIIEQHIEPFSQAEKAFC